MNIFDEIDENLFRPLTGTNKRKYADIPALIWDKCKRMPMYSIEKSTVFDMAEEYLLEMLMLIAESNKSEVFESQIDDFMQRIMIDVEEHARQNLSGQKSSAKSMGMYVDYRTYLDYDIIVKNPVAMFKYSKRFQREFKSTVESILFDYTDEVVEKDKILEYYNLYENSTYVYIKGDIVIKFENSVIYVREINGGIALSNSALEKIKEIKVIAKSVITVENLTTYHDEDEKDSVYIYLGGYHNRSKQVILKKIYDENKHCEYLHEGDIDVYGFLILENLREKTGISFKPLNMGVDTLKRFFDAKIYKELTASDINMIEKKKGKLGEYRQVLEFMLLHNCKVEQESIRAVEILN